MKQFLVNFWKIESHIRAHIYLTRAISRLLIVGPYVAMLLDRLLLIVYGIDLNSTSIKIQKLSISHPVGILLGGNGIISSGRVAIMAGVKFVARSPLAPEYLKLHKERRVFRLGDNVVIGTGVVLIGPLEVCDDVVIGAMSLVNKNILEPGVYVGTPAKKISDNVTNEWVAHL